MEQDDVCYKSAFYQCKNKPDPSRYFPRKNIQTKCMINDFDIFCLRVAQIRKELTPSQLANIYRLVTGNRFNHFNLSAFCLLIQQTEHFNKNRSFITLTNGPDHIFKFIAEKILQEEPTSDMKILCQSCQLNSKNCKLCAFQNSSLSVLEMHTYEKMMNNIHPFKKDGKQMLMVKYLFNHIGISIIR